MIYFSYNDYLDCMENGKISNIERVEEKISKYETQNGKIVNYQNDIIQILKNKWELKNFLKNFLNFECRDSIIYYDCKTNISDKNTNNNLICKLENKEIFIFIKVTNKIDNNISYKIFEHVTDIIKRWNKDKKEKTRYPIVIPIVIYTGKKQWKKNKKKIKYISYEENRMNFSYNTININNFETTDLQLIESQLAKEFIKIKNRY